MREKKHTPKESHSLKTFILFCVVVSVLILGSITAKAIVVIRQSIYDPTHQFILVTEGAGEDTAMIYDFNKPKGTITTLQLKNISHKVPIEKVTGVLADASLPTEKPLLTPHLSSILFSPGNQNKTVTAYDLLRLSAFLHITSPGNRTDETVSFPTDDKTLQKLIQQLFSDDTITKENASIEIINATGESGVGTRLERVLTNCGANVIAVDTADQESNATTVKYTGELTYTAKKIAWYLHVEPLSTIDHSLSDIIVTIGKDSLRRNTF